MKAKTSRSEFRAPRRDNSGIVDRLSGGKGKFKVIESDFMPNLSAADLEGKSIVGTITAVDQWKHKNKSGTSIVLENGDTKVKMPLYTTIANRLAKHQGNKEVNLKKLVGLTVKLSCLGFGDAKNGNNPPALFEVAVAQ
jgi:hypothetical protein